MIYSISWSCQKNMQRRTETPFIASISHLATCTCLVWDKRTVRETTTQMLNKSQGLKECGHICSTHLLGIFALYHYWNSREVLQKSHVPEQRKTRDGTEEEESTRTCNGGELRPQRRQHGFVKLNWIKSHPQLLPNLMRQKISPLSTHHLLLLPLLKTSSAEDGDEVPSCFIHEASPPAILPCINLKSLN